MTTRYQESQIEDVADLLSAAIRNNTQDDRAHQFIGQKTIEGICYSFADLFVADNPPYDYCGHCGIQPPFHIPCVEREEHSIYHHKGFNRTDFLAACGLESER